MNDDLASEPTRARDFDHSNLMILLKIFEQDGNYEKSLADLPDLLRRFVERSFGVELNVRDCEPVLQRLWPTLPSPSWDQLTPSQRHFVVNAWVGTNNPETKRSERARKNFCGDHQEEPGTANVPRSIRRVSAAEVMLLDELQRERAHKAQLRDPGLAVNAPVSVETPTDSEVPAPDDGVPPDASRVMAWLVGEQAQRINAGKPYGMSEVRVYLLYQFPHLTRNDADRLYRTLPKTLKPSCGPKGPWKNNTSRLKS